MHEALFANSQRLTAPTLLLIAAQVGVDPGQLRAALTNQSFAPKVEADFAGGLTSGVNGTPCFFINGRRYDGPHDAMSLVAAIEMLLRSRPQLRPRIEA
jgi:2-hydroxychromene-2-carboxylate isomerase